MSLLLSAEPLTYDPKRYALKTGLVLKYSFIDSILAESKVILQIYKILKEPRLSSWLNQLAVGS